MQTGKVYDAVVRVGHLLPPTIAAVEGAAVGAGLNLMLATDLRVVAKDARILAGFMRTGLHPGGGHFALMGRVTGYEPAAALSLFGEEIDGARAQSLGIAWEALAPGEVLSRALELAGRVAGDPDLARMVVASCRSELGPPVVPWSLAVQAERGPQMWSLRRRGLRETAR
jgi:enoyl-CoA hydratase